MWNERQYNFWTQRITKNIEEYGQIIVHLKEKHGEAFYVANSIQEFQDICLYILWVRYHDSYYLPPEEVSQPSLTKEFIDSMPESQPKVVAVKEWERYELNLAMYKDELLEYELIKKALEERNGIIACSILDKRTSYEYEGFEITYPDEVDLPTGNLLDD